MSLGLDESVRSGRRARVINRLPINPMDKSTIVSILPKVINEYKPTIFPSRFVIPPAKVGDFEILVIEPSSWYMANANEGGPPIEIQVNSAQLAKSIVVDYCNGIYLCDMQERMPGLFWVLGAHNRITINTATDETGRTFNQLLEDARRKQKNWLAAQVEAADILWAKSGGSPLAISDDARLGAELLQLDKPWMKDAKAMELTNCKACGELINPNFPVCKHCHAIHDAARAKELGITFAAQ